MRLGEVFERFIQQAPISVMFRTLLEHTLDPAEIDRLFEENADRQYTREVLFSSIVELMGSVVCGAQPSVRAAYLASLGEIIGYRRVYLVGLALFTLASVFCALAHTLSLLTVARIVQGFGAAGIMSQNGALVRFTYPSKMLGKGLGLNALVASAGAAGIPFWPCLVCNSVIP